jgi:hypothetical protein
MACIHSGDQTSLPAPLNDLTQIRLNALIPINACAAANYKDLVKKRVTIEGTLERERAVDMGGSILAGKSHQPFLWSSAAPPGGAVSRSRSPIQLQNRSVQPERR